MTKVQKETGNSESGQVHDTGADYVSSEKKIMVSSIQEQDENNYMYWASLSPEQRLEVHYQMITRIYSNELKKSKPYNDLPICSD